MGFLAKYTDPIYAALRIVAGFLFACHGADKLFGVFGGQKFTAATPLPFAAGIIELVAGVLIMVGFFGGIAAFIASGQMAVAYFIGHQGKGALPIQNGGELAALYSFVFLYIAARGSGIWSIDAARGPRRR